MANKENIKKWVDALESGEYEQATGALRNEDGFCCLGVACEVAVKNDVIPEPGVSETTGRYKYGSQGSADFLPQEVQDWLGLGASRPSVKVGIEGGRYDVELNNLNDEYEWSFRGIAQAIRENYLEG